MSSPALGMGFHYPGASDSDPMFSTKCIIVRKFLECSLI